jgi:hypothetical protein
MLNSRIRVVMTCLGTAAMLLAVPAEAKAFRCLDCLFGWCSGSAQTTYRPPYVPWSYAPACGPSCTPCPPQTCRYVPQTCYRTVYQRVPVTTCQAMTTCDPCTGCPVTTYRPVTTWTCQARLVPYTTYRLVYSNPCSPYVSYGPAYGGTVVGTVSSVCPSCTSSPSTTSVPYTEPSGNGTVPRTFQESQKPIEEKDLEPIPKATGTPSNHSPAPTIIDPSNRTTAQPVRQGTYFHLIASPPRPVTLTGPPSPLGVWRPSSD